MISKGDKVSFNPALIEMEYQGKLHTDLSEDLISWRAYRPDEWTTNRFIRDAAKLERERNELAAQVERLRADVLEEIENRDHNEEVTDMLANEIARFFGVDIGEHSTSNSPWDNAFEAVPNTTLVALKAQWQAEVVQSILDEREHWSQIVEQLKHERDDASALTIRYKNLLEYAIRVKEFKSIINDLEIMIDCGERK